MLFWSGATTIKGNSALVRIHLRTCVSQQSWFPSKRFPFRRSFQVPTTLAQGSKFCKNLWRWKISFRDVSIRFANAHNYFLKNWISSYRFDSHRGRGPKSDHCLKAVYWISFQTSLRQKILLAWRRAKDFEPGYGVLSTSGAIFIWGRNAWGQLGNGNQLEHNSPLLLKTIRDQNVEFVTMGEGRKTDDKGDRENVGLNW